MRAIMDYDAWLYKCEERQKARINNNGVKKHVKKPSRSKQSKRSRLTKERSSSSESTTSTESVNVNHILSLEADGAVVTVGPSKTAISAVAPRVGTYKQFQESNKCDGLNNCPNKDNDSRHTVTDNPFSILKPLKRKSDVVPKNITDALKLSVQSRPVILSSPPVLRRTNRHVVGDMNILKKNNVVIAKEKISGNTRKQLVKKSITNDLKKKLNETVYRISNEALVRSPSVVSRRSSNLPTRVSSVKLSNVKQTAVYAKISDVKKCQNTLVEKNRASSKKSECRTVTQHTSNSNINNRSSSISKLTVVNIKGTTSKSKSLNEKKAEGVTPKNAVIKSKHVMPKCNTNGKIKSSAQKKVPTCQEKAKLGLKKLAKNVKSSPEKKAIEKKAIGLVKNIISSPIVKMVTKKVVGASKNVAKTVKPKQAKKRIPTAAKKNAAVKKNVVAKKNVSLVAKPVTKKNQNPAKDLVKAGKRTSKQKKTVTVNLKKKVTAKKPPLKIQSKQTPVKKSTPAKKTVSNKIYPGGNKAPAKLKLPQTRGEKRKFSPSSSLTAVPKKRKA